MGIGIRKLLKSVACGMLDMAKSAVQDRGVGFGVGEYEDFDNLRRSARDEAEREADGLSGDAGAELSAIEDGIPEISTEELKEALASKTPPRLVDVREVYEWEAGHIQGAQHIALGSLEERLSELKKNDGMIVTYCAAGMRSIDGAYVLKQNGYGNVRSLAGGISAWGASGGEIAH